jgi:hypothetical protein
MPIQGVGTSTPAFVGFAETYHPLVGSSSDPDGVKPQRITSFAQYERIYGGYGEGIFLPHTRSSNGGSACYVVRIPRNGQRPQRALTGAGRRTPETPTRGGQAGRRPHRGRRRRPAGGGGGQAGAGAHTFSLSVRKDGNVVGTYPSLDLRNPERVTQELATSEQILARVVIPEGLPPEQLVLAPGTYALESPAKPAQPATVEQFAGSAAKRTGYEGLIIADDVTMVAVPTW